VVHSHVHHASGALLWLAHRAGVPVRIAHSHNARDGRQDTPWRRLYRSWSRRLINRHATAGVAVATEAADGLFGGAWRRDPRLRVIPYGIDLTRFEGRVARDEVRRQLGFPADARVVGQLGRFHPVKNHAFTLRVAGALCRRDPRVRVLFIGDGPGRGPAEREAEGLGIRDRCAFVGTVVSDLPRLLEGGVDLLLSPSLWEGLPVSLLEAQAAGLPVLASTRITREVEAVPGLVRFLDLDDGPDRWAEEALAVLDLPGPTLVDAQAAMAGTAFDIRRCARDILELYESPEPR
jgi:glycosyltransferase involved in cell wall biosynthesis